MTHPLLLDDPTAGRSGSVVLHVASGSTGLDPETALRLIEQAREGMHRLEEWQDAIQVQAGKLVHQIQQERAAFAADIEDLQDDIAALRRQVDALHAALAEATSAKDAASMQCAAAKTQATAAERRALAAEKRAQVAEDWLVRLQLVVSDEFSAS